MRAIRSDGRRVMLEQGTPTPQAEAGWVVLRPIRIAVTREESAWARGAPRRGGPGVVTLGRECVATVVSCGPGVDTALVGRRVVPIPEVVCGTCDRCRGGLSAHCEARRDLGDGLDGCMADAFAAPARNLVATPAGMDDDDAVMCHAVGRALRVAQVADAESRRFVTVVGDSAEAILSAQALARASTAVRILGDDMDRLARCERWGIKHRAIAEVGRRGDQDVVVEAAGTASGFALALGLVRPRGLIVCAVPPREPRDHAPAHEREVSVSFVRAGSVSEALAALSRRQIDAAGLIARRHRLADGLNALHAAVTQPVVVIDP